MKNNPIIFKINQIGDSIQKKIQYIEANTPIGLYTGDAGYLLFLFYYSKFLKENTLNDSFVDLLTDTLLDKLCSNVYFHSYCGGLSGVLYLFDFLKEKKILNIDLSDAEESLENYLIWKMREDIKISYYDFMHGAIGVGLYFLKKGEKLHVIDELLNYLYNTAEKNDTNSLYKWQSITNEQTGERGYNISFSHGMASIVLFLTRCVQKNINNEYLHEMLVGTVNYILSQKINTQLYGSHFPSLSKAKIRRSRLAWCYGDLGIAFSLYYAGEVTQNVKWKKEGLNILLDSTKREVDSSDICDAGICHGCAGVAMIYRRMYLKTSMSEFSEATNFWTKRIFDYANNEDGLVGFKAFKLKEKEKDDYSLLTGISGIGLYLISYMMNDTQDWDELFLLG